MLKRFSYYLLSVVFVAGIAACVGQSHDHRDYAHDHEHAEEAETIEQLALLVAKEYKVTPDEVYEDVEAVVQLLKAKEILL